MHFITSVAAVRAALGYGLAGAATLFMTCAFAADANAANLYEWDAEAVDSNTSPYTYQPFGNSLLDDGQAHTGARSVRVDVAGNDAGNQQLGFDTIGHLNLGFDVLGSELYFRWWMMFDSGFDWGDNANPKIKMSRVLGVQSNRVYTGYISKSGGVSLAECDGAGGCEVAGGGSASGSVAAVPIVGGWPLDGEWHEYVVRVKANSAPTAFDAELEVWKDGQSQGQATAFKLHVVTPNSYLEAWHCWGIRPYAQLNSSYPAGGSIWFDDFSTDDTFNSVFAAGGGGSGASGGNGATGGGGAAAGGGGTATGGGGVVGGGGVAGSGAGVGSGEADDEGGCSMRRAKRSSTFLALVGLWLGMAALRRRKRTQSPAR